MKGSKKVEYQCSYLQDVDVIGRSNPICNNPTCPMCGKACPVIGMPLICGRERLIEVVPSMFDCLRYAANAINMASDKYDKMMAVLKSKLEEVGHIGITEEYYREFDEHEYKHGDKPWFVSLTGVVGWEWHRTNIDGMEAANRIVFLNKDKTKAAVFTRNRHCGVVYELSQETCGLIPGQLIAKNEFDKFFSRFWRSSNNQSEYVSPSGVFKICFDSTGYGYVDLNQDLRYRVGQSVFRVELETSPDWENKIINFGAPNMECVYTNVGGAMMVIFKKGVDYAIITDVNSN